MAVLFHPVDGKIDEQSLSEEAHLGAIDLLHGDVVRFIESIANLPEVIRIFFCDFVGYPLAPAINDHGVAGGQIAFARKIDAILGQVQR